MTSATRESFPGNPPLVANVLLVDDHPPNLLALEATLEPLGLRTVRAASGTEALEKLLREEFAVILLDVQMPGMDGFETAAVIRGRDRTRTIPIIFVTAIHRDEAHHTKGYAHGAVDYIAKPFNPDVLRAKVSALVDLWRRDASLRLRETELFERERRELFARERAALDTAETERDRYRLVARATNDAIWDWDLTTNLICWNPSVTALFGHPVEQIDPDASWWLENVHPGDRERIETGIHAVIDSDKELWSDQYRFCRADGTYADVFDRGFVQRDAAGKAVRMIGSMLDRTEARRAEEALERTAREAALGADVGAALTRAGALRAALDASAAAIVRHLGAAFARIWTLPPGSDVLELEASAGMYTHIDGPHARVPVGQFKIGLIAHECRPHLSNDVPHDPRISDPAWAARERMVAFAGYPLVVDGRVVGVMAMFACHPLADDVLTALGSTADTIALGIERRRAEAQTLDREAELRSLLDSTAEGIWGLDPQGRCTFANPASVAMLGYRSASELLGRDMHTTAHHARADGTPYTRAECPICRCVERGEVAEVDDEVLWRTDGSSFPARYRVAPVRRDGKIVGAIVAIENATARKAAALAGERALLAERAARESAESANRAKDEFLSTVSHELRTPLNAILGWTRMLRSGSLAAAKQTSALETIERNAKAQAQLIEDLLDVARIISGKMRLDVRPMEPAEAVANAVEVVRPAADAKDIRIQAIVDPGAGTILGDPDRIQQVIWNLLTNAVKFTARGGRVHVSVRRADSHIALAVTDSGRGIEREFLPHVFDRFRQADGSATRDKGGLGLGLAIVRHLVELHGGTIDAQSEGLGHGATFIVRLPIAAVQRAPVDRPADEKPATLALDRPPVLTGLRVLVVDDEEDARNLVASVLEHCAAVVKTASNADEALCALRDFRPDAIVSDIGMPGEDGYSFIRKVRALPAAEGGETPALALTAYARSEDRTRAMRSGFEMHMAKPVEPAELLLVLAHLARRFVRH